MFLPFSVNAQSWEVTANSLRQLGKVRRGEHLDPWLLAPKVGLTVLESHPDLLKDLNTRDQNQLLGSGRDGWSGGVYPVPLPDGTRLCILNGAHNKRRKKITLMEEIVHVHLKHSPTRIVSGAPGVSFRDYDKSQEEQAFGVGAAALLPWPELFSLINSGQTFTCIADKYDVSSQLVNYRINVTGARKLYCARQGRPKARR